MADEGIGVHLIERLAAMAGTCPDVDFIDAGQFVIGVDRDLVTIDIAHHDTPLAAVSGLGGEGHSGLDLVHTLECGDRHYLQQFGVVLAVALRGLDDHIERFAGGLAGQRVLEAGDDVAAAVQVGQGLGAL